MTSPVVLAVTEGPCWELADAPEQGCLVEMPREMRTRVFPGRVEETVLTVDLRESCSQRQLELPRAGRESNRLNMTRCLNWAKRGERKMGKGREEEKREGPDETERRPREETTEEREPREGVAKMAGIQKLEEWKQSLWAGEI